MVTSRSLYSLATEIACASRLRRASMIHRRRHVVLRDPAGRDQIGHRRQDVRAVDAVASPSRARGCRASRPRRPAWRRRRRACRAWRRSPSPWRSPAARRPSARCSRGSPSSPPVLALRRCATPNGNCVCTAPTSAAVPAVAFRNVRRLMPPVLLVPLVVICFGVLSLRCRCVRTASRAQLAGNKKSRSPREALLAFPPGQRRCLCGPPLDRPGVVADAGFQSLLFKRRANSAEIERICRAISAPWLIVGVELAAHALAIRCCL